MIRTHNKQESPTRIPRREAARLPSIKPATGGRDKSGCVCGGGCPRCQAQTPQPKLTVGAPDDVYEREAERIADTLVSGGSTGAEAEGRGGNVVQRVPAAGAALASDTGAQAAMTDMGTGRPLDTDSRRFFEPRLGHDLSGVRVHTGAHAAASADALSARAYTLGRNIVFGAGEYTPGSAGGRQLLAHELVHVVQQAGGPLHAPARQTPTPPPASAAPIGAAAYSVRLLTEEGERFIGPDLSAPEGASVPAADAGADTAETTAPVTTTPEDAPQETVPVHRMPKNKTPAVWVQRKATFTKPTPNAQDPLARLAQGLTPGLTTPKVNGNKTSNLQQLINDIAPTQVKQTGKSGGNITCAVDNFNVDTTAEEIVAAAAPAGGWTAKVPPAQIGNPAKCAKVAQVPVTMNAQPNNADFVKRVQQSEDEHVADLKALHDRHLVPYDKFITGLTGTGKDLTACGQDLVGKLNNQHTAAGFAVAYGWMAAKNRLDGPGGTHEDTALVNTAADCSSATITLSQSNPTIAGSGPGNVVTVAPQVQTFDPKKLKVVATGVMEGSTVIKTFSDAATAQTALQVMQHYGMTSRNIIGSMEYFLVGNAAPSGALKGANELAIDPTRYQVTLDLPNAGDWAITDTAGTAKAVSINVIANFGTKRDEAYSAWAVLTSFGFTVQGWVGGTRQKPEMMYFRV